MVCKLCKAKGKRREEIKARMFKPRFLVDNTVTKRGTKNMKKGWTMVLTFSRPWCVRPFFRAFEKLEFDRSKCHLLIYNNANNVYLDRLLRMKAKRYMQYHKMKYRRGRYYKPFASVRLYKSFRKYGGIVFGQEVSFDKSKLPGIADMQRDIAGMITTKFFFQIEDDTIVPPWGVRRLFRILTRSKRTGVVCGVEPTRSPRPTDKARLGAYYLKRTRKRIWERISLDPKLRYVQDVDAVGFYCNAVRTEAWLKGMALFDKEMKRQKTAEPNWAIDTLWTNDVKRSGYKVLADMETPCMHMQIMGNSIMFWAMDKAVKKIDYYVRKYKVYAQGVVMR